MADWVTISSLATAGGTLALAVSTFASVRSANSSARVAERALLAGLRPVLVPSREDDPTEPVGFGDGRRLLVPGNRAVIEVGDNGHIYMAMTVRNAGAGLAVLHGWDVHGGATSLQREPVAVESFHRLQRDIYVPAGELGFWQGRLRDPEERGYQEVVTALREGTRINVDILYGDHEGGQRTITRFGVVSGEDELRETSVTRYWNIDREDPR